MPINFKKVTFNDRIGVGVNLQDPNNFLPEGFDYDYKRAEQAGMTRQLDPETKEMHLGSVAPTTKAEREKYGLPEESYVLLKGKQHESWDKAVKGEAERGFRVKQYGDRYYSVPAEINTEGKDVEINNKSVIDYAYDKLLSTEGVAGDTASDVATGKRGLTTKLYNSLKDKYNNQKMTQEEASKIYLQESYDSFSKIKGFNKLTQDEQISILDNAYNLGYENMQGYKNFMAALKEGTDKDAIFKNLLDTAKVEGKSSKGVAKRRAEAYNVGNPDDPITRVEQTANGIIYHKGDKEYFRFNAPKSEASKVGIIDIVSD